MTMKLLPLLLALAFSFSGCLFFGEGEVDTVEDVDMLLADVTQGPAPLNVTFSLDNGDQDVNWTLHLGDGETETGDELPAMVEHVYMMPGNFTARLYVGDDDRPAELDITVTGGFGITQEHTGGWMASIPLYCALAGEIVEPLNGIFTEWIDVDGESLGRPFAALMTSDLEEAILDYRVQFATVEGGFEVVESFSESPGQPIVGTVPDDAERVYFTACGVSGPVEVQYVAV